MNLFDLFYVALGTLSVLAAAYCLFVPSVSLKQKKFTLVFWLIAPPVFFFLEYYFRQGGLDGRELERVKDMQDRAAAIWAGVPAALAAIYFKE